jgi:hypothetical protein
MNSLTYYFKTTMNILGMQNVWRGRQWQAEVPVEECCRLSTVNHVE